MKAARIHAYGTPGVIRVEAAPLPDIAPNAAILRAIAALVDAGKIRPLIGSEHRLDHAANAHVAAETSRTTDKTVICTGQP